MEKTTTKKKITIKKDFVKDVKIGNDCVGNANLEFRVTAPHVCLLYTKFEKHMTYSSLRGYGEMDKKQVRNLIKSLQACLAKMVKKVP
jgi:hypothetical protein